VYGHDGALAVVVAEVNNTFGERHTYVLEGLERGPGGRWLPRTSTPKAFHVSPFNDLAGAYRFELSDPLEKLDVRVRLEKDGAPVFTARLEGAARPLTTRDWLAVTAQHPLTLALTVPRIAFEAARLSALKRLPVVPKPRPADPRTIVTARPGWIDRALWPVLERAFARGDQGRLDLRLPNGAVRAFGRDSGRDAPAALDVRGWRFARRLARGGDIALGEAYTDGDWTSPDLVRTLTWLHRNRSRMESAAGPLPALTARRRPAPRSHTGNTPRRTRENARRHYDLGNDFFSLFLDDSLTYSSARFSCACPEPLEAAQERKIDLVLDKAALPPGARLLELGSGWGALALRAGARIGARVESLTLSAQQLALARTRARAAGLEDRVRFELADYRRAEGTFDAVVSVEMLEAVGHRYYGQFFGTLDRVLAPGGRAVLQTILIADARYGGYLERADWIQKHIFPGGIVPSLSALTEAMRQSSRLALTHVESFGEDYARTLRLWRERFLARRDEALALGYDESFLRKWEYYLAYCETGFRERELTVAQLVLARPGEASVAGANR
jgi:cyclopropane-fatty-acyl-phospholipid synthase